MITRTPSRSRARSRVRPTAVSHDLVWIHDGIRCRATVWPEVKFEQEVLPGEWHALEPSEEALGSAALGVSPVAWKRYLEFVPAAERSFLEKFRFARMSALLVLVRCPELLSELSETPALVVFLAAHLNLRGGCTPRWGEIIAVYEREGLFGLLQWLGLPASRQTITILRHVTEPDLPRRLLEPLRAALWEPEAIWVLANERHLTDARIAAACHALAA